MHVDMQYGVMQKKMHAKKYEIVKCKIEFKINIV